MASLFSRKIFYKGPSFGSFLPWELKRFELPLTKVRHPQEDDEQAVTVDVAAKKEENFNEKFARCIEAGCLVTERLGEDGCKVYPGFEHSKWTNGKTCPIVYKSPEVVEGEKRKKRAGQQKQNSGRPDGVRKRKGGNQKSIIKEPAPPTLVKTTRTD